MSPSTLSDEFEDLSAADRRRASYRRLVDGDLQSGPLGRVLFLVRSVDLRHAGPDLRAACGLGLALSQRGYGVRLVPQHRWHLGGPADIWIATVPDCDPSFALPGSWRIAWAHRDATAWAQQDHLIGYDQVLAGSAVAGSRLRAAGAHRVDVLGPAVDTELFTARPHERSEIVAVELDAERGETIAPAMSELPAATPLGVHVEPVPRMNPALLARLREHYGWLRTPDPLNQALLSVTELGPTAMGDATVPPSVLEAIACGALPIINSALGARDLGLDLPTYTSSRELDQQIRALIADPDGCGERVAEQRRIVGERHTWATRASELVSLVDDARGTGSAPPASAPRNPLHYFPDYNSANPYQGMLFAELPTFDAYPVAVHDVVAHLEQRAVSARPGALNIHWTTPILQYAEGPFRAAIELDRFTGALHRFRAAGGRLVWTLHNVLPHEARHVWAETQLAQLLADRADAIHALSAITARQAAEVLRIDPRRVVVIEHSSYVGCYPDWISRDAARRRLGLESDNIVLVALGGIRPYKGLGRLLDVFHELADEDDRLRLLVAGKPAQTQETAGLQRRCETSPLVISEFSHVPDDQLQVWFGAGDLAVLPYSRILNSGVFWLAQSFGLPTVGPRAGALLDLADEEHVRLFNPRDDRSLKDTLRTAIAELVEDSARAVLARQSSYAAAVARRPHQMAALFGQFIEPLLSEQTATSGRAAG